MSHSYFTTVTYSHQEKKAYYNRRIILQFTSKQQSTLVLQENYSITLQDSALQALEDANANHEAGDFYYFGAWQRSSHTKPRLCNAFTRSSVVLDRLDEDMNSLY